MVPNKTNNIDNYLAGFPKEIQEILQQVRSAISKAAPAAEETINYGMPTFTLKGNLVHFAGYKNHIGFYPAPSGIETFKKRSKSKQQRNLFICWSYNYHNIAPIAFIVKIKK